MKKMVYNLGPSWSPWWYVVATKAGLYEHELPNTEISVHDVSDTQKSLIENAETLARMLRIGGLHFDVNR